MKYSISFRRRLSSHEAWRILATLAVTLLVATWLVATQSEGLGEGLAWLGMTQQGLQARVVGQQAEGRVVTKEEQGFNGALEVLVAGWVAQGLGGSRHPPWGT